MKAFTDFMRKEGVVGIAAGFVVGGAISRVVENFTVYVLDPLVAWVFNTTNFANQRAIIGDGADAVQVNWGIVAVLLVNVLVVVLTVWGLARWLGYAKGNKKK